MNNSTIFGKKMSSCSMGENLIAALRIQDKEDIITNMMAYCINASDLFARVFLCSLSCADHGPRATYMALTRQQTPNGNPDLAIAVKTGSREHLIVIENKINADEGYDQTKRYAAKKCTDALLKRFGVGNEKWASQEFVLWTLFPDPKPQSSAFKVATYQNVLKSLVENIHSYPELVQIMARSFVDTYTIFYEAAIKVTSPEQRLLELLVPNDNLESSYLVFKRMMESIPLPNGLLLEGCSRSSNRGRRHYVAVWNRPSWYTNRQSEEKFHLHLEAQWHAIPKRFSLYIHYEPYEYMPDKRLRNELGDKAYNHYIKQRQRYIDTFRELAEDTGVIANLDWARAGCNQVARFDGLNIDDNTTVKMLTDCLSEAIRNCHALMSKALSLTR